MNSLINSSAAESLLWAVSDERVSAFRLLATSTFSRIRVSYRLPISESDEFFLV